MRRREIRILPCLLAALLAAVLVPPARAAVRPAAEQAKIDYLIGEVSKARGTFLRNGREHTPARAASHLARKLKFAGRRVQTVRDFVEGIATRSSETGKPYEIRWPDGRREQLGKWLKSRLTAYEKRAS